MGGEACWQSKDFPTYPFYFGYQYLSPVVLGGGCYQWEQNPKRTLPDGMEGSPECRRNFTMEQS